MHRAVTDLGMLYRIGPHKCCCFKTFMWLLRLCTLVFKMARHSSQSNDKYVINKCIYLEILCIFHRSCFVFSFCSCLCETFWSDFDNGVADP